MDRHDDILKRRTTPALHQVARTYHGRDDSQAKSAGMISAQSQPWLNTPKISAWGQQEWRDLPLRKGLRIGVNCDVFEQCGKIVTCLDSRYIDCLRIYGAEVFLLAAGSKGGDLRGMLRYLDGLVMIGGGDLDPRFDGFYKHPSQTLLHPRREMFDRQLVRQVRGTRLPLLAIGAGMQTLNVVCGGTLFYHVPEDKPLEPAHYHPSDTDHGHMVYFHRQSLVSQAYPECCADVRSRHHMAVDDVAIDFTPTAWSAGGLVEAIESISIDWLALGVQWHPEHRTAHELDPIVFELWLRALGAGKSRDLV